MSATAAVPDRSAADRRDAAARALARGCEHLLSLQQGPGFWKAELERTSRWTPRTFGLLANNVSIFGKGDQAMGFAAKSDEAKTFLIGSFYSEALAYVRGGKMDLALERLKSMEREFIVMGAPNSVNALLSRIGNLVATKKYDAAVILDFLDLVQPVCEDYLLSKGKDRLTLFQAGAWLMDMGLAAAAKDKSLLKQPDVLNYFIAEMKRLDAPKGVQDSLTEISAISAKKDIVDRDAEQVLKLIKRIQSVLG